MFSKWNTYQAVTIGFTGGPSQGPLVLGHAYTVVSFTRDAAGTITTITVRNPWGIDGASSSDSNPWDGLVTLTVAQLSRYQGFTSWGRV